MHREMARDGGKQVYGSNSKRQKGSGREVSKGKLRQEEGN